MTEDRLIDIESKLAHQEILLDKLAALVADQQAVIHQLEDAVKVLAKHIRGQPQKAIGPANEKPPHY